MDSLVGALYSMHQLNALPTQMLQSERVVETTGLQRLKVWLLHTAQEAALRHAQSWVAWIHSLLSLTCMLPKTMGLV